MVVGELKVSLISLVANTVRGEEDTFWISQTEIIVFACRLMTQVVTLAAIKRMLCVDSLGNRFVLTSLMHSVVQVAEARVSGNLTFVNLLLPDIKVCKSAFKHFLFTLEKQT